jgi:hypothetical protein
MIAGMTYELTKTPTQAWKVRNFKHNGLRRIRNPIRRKLSRTSNDLGSRAKNVASSERASDAGLLKEEEGGAKPFDLPFEDEVVAPGDILDDREGIGADWWWQDGGRQ